MRVWCVLNFNLEITLGHGVLVTALLESIGQNSTINIAAAH